MEHHFDVDIAKEFGIEEAVIINHFQFWLRKNSSNGTNFHDGRHWTFNSQKAMLELFPYLTEKMLRTAMSHLIDRGVLIDGNYSENKYDRTKWYAFADEEKWICQKRQMDSPKTANGFADSGEPIPDNNTQIKDTDNNTPLSPKGKSHKVLDLSFVDREDFIPIMEQWLAYKKEKGQTYKPTGLRTCYKKLVEYSNGNAEKAKQIIEEAMSNNYSGFFPLKQQSNGNNNRSNIQYGNPLYEGIVREMERNGITGF